MLDMTTINIDFDQILDIAQKGVRRSSVFMGLGVNASLDRTLTDYQLTKIANIQLVPTTVPEETLNHFKEEFRIWVEANGFRELVETFSIFLDKIHHVCLLIKTQNSDISEEENRKRQKDFEGKGYPDKLKLLNDSFEISPNHPKYLRSLNKARNCLTHRRGVVGLKDIDAKKELQIEWIGLDIWAETPDNEKVMLLDIPPEGILFAKGGTVKAQFVDRRKIFHLGELLRLSTRDIAEICWMFSIEAKATTSSAIQYCKKMGIVIVDKTPQEVAPLKKP